MKEKETSRVISECPKFVCRECRSKKGRSHEEGCSLARPDLKCSECCFEPICKRPDRRKAVGDE